MQAVLVLAALAASGLAGRYFFQRQFVYQIESRLREALVLLSRHVPARPDSAWCQHEARETAFHFSVAYHSGEELCDSDVTSDKVVNDIFADLQKSLGPGSFRARIQGPAIYGVLDVAGGNLILRGTAPLTHLSQTLAVFDTSLVFFLLLVALGLLMLAVWSARQMVFPLGRLLLKTQSVLSQQPEHLSKEDLQRESFDEWLELESNIDDIRRDLVEKARNLSMEQVELETIMGAISDAILAVDPDGNPLFFNSRFELLFGKEGLRRRNSQLWGIFRDPEILAAFTGALKDGRVGGTKAIPLEQEGGLRRYFSLSVSPLRRREGTIYGAVGIFHDVTELKSAEQMRIDFVANVSHELRTPLTVIKGYADTLIDDHKHLGGPTLEYLNSIARNSDRLMNLMNDLLDLSSIESTDVIQRDPLSTEEVTQRILAQLSGAFDTKYQSLHAIFGASTVLADGQRVEQVLVNLLGNANKYTPQNGHITVAWENDGSDVLLKVSNDGPAIPKEHHARLFERFYRIDKSRSRDQGGTGLGLAIVKHIMQRHGGTVWVESSPPKQGATFICRFPGSQGLPAST